MSGASGTLDPIEAARADIAQSRNLIASVTHDLHRTQRWFDGYQLSEKRHARRLKRQELLYQLELKRQQVVRFSRRTALSAARNARDIYRTLYAASVVALHFLARNASAAAAWAAPKLRTAWLWLDVQARRLSLACARASTATGTWTAAQARALWQTFARTAADAWGWTEALLRAFSQTLVRVAAQAWAWTARQAPIVWHRTVTVASDGLARTQTNLRALGKSLRSTLSFIAVWLRVEFDAAAFATSSAASTAAGWSARKGRRGAVQAIRLSRQTRTLAGDAARATATSSAVLLERATAAVIVLRDRFGTWPTRGTSESTCRALVVRRSTALVCVAPVRTQLPVLRVEPPEVQPHPKAKPPRKSKPKPKRTARTKTKARAKPRAKPKTKPKPRRAPSKRKTASARRQPQA